MTAKQYQRARRDLARIAAQLYKAKDRTGHGSGILPLGVIPRCRKVRDELLAVAQLSP